MISCLLISRRKDSSLLRSSRLPGELLLEPGKSYLWLLRRLPFRLVQQAAAPPQGLLPSDICSSAPLSGLHPPVPAQEKAWSRGHLLALPITHLGLHHLPVYCSLCSRRLLQRLQKWWRSCLEANLSATLGPSFSGGAIRRDHKEPFDLEISNYVVLMLCIFWWP